MDQMKIHRCGKSARTFFYITRNEFYPLWIRNWNFFALYNSRKFIRQVPKLKYLANFKVNFFGTFFQHFNYLLMQMFTVEWALISIFTVEIHESSHRFFHQVHDNFKSMKFDSTLCFLKKFHCNLLLDFFCRIHIYACLIQTRMYQIIANKFCL